MKPWKIFLLLIAGLPFLLIIMYAYVIVSLFQPGGALD